MRLASRTIMPEAPKSDIEKKVKLASGEHAFLASCDAAVEAYVLAMEQAKKLYARHVLAQRSQEEQ